jgi:KDO2-lipid IV(A) lauroyltransferase
MMAANRLAVLVRWKSRQFIERAAGPATTAALTILRTISSRRSRAICAALMRTIGPFLPEHRTGRNNLKAAFPDKSDREIETILRGVWDNLGRVVAEFVNLDRLGIGDIEGQTAIVSTAEERERLYAIRRAPPTLIFGAHLANWEVPAAIGAAVGNQSAVLYRRPNIGAVADAVMAMRSNVMGTMIPQGLDAPLRLARAIQDGKHAAMLIDQHFSRGVEVTFFGRRCMANPLIAMLARQLECPVRGVRVIRQPDDRFRGHISDEIPLPRDAEGKVDIAATMQDLTSMIETWVREYPDQWLWLHRRWR